MTSWSAVNVLMVPSSSTKKLDKARWWRRPWWRSGPTTAPQPTRGSSRPGAASCRAGLGVGAGAPRPAPPRGPLAAMGLGRQADPVVAALEAVLGNQLSWKCLAVKSQYRVSNSSRTSINVPPAPAASRPCPAGGHTIPPPLPPRTGPASAGRCAPKPQEPTPPQIGSTGDPETARKLPRTSSAVSLATSPSASSTLPPVGAPI